jgi:phospholipid/cholesterol/gamma-HCH transport system substrate-binding protein
MAIFNRSKKKGEGMSPLKAGAIGLVVIVIFTFFAWTQYNPLHRPFQFTATFKSANNLKPRSPVRIAGVEVGMVKKVEPIPDGNGAAKVTMQVEKVGLPIHKDAQLKIRPRIFLEGNFFVDIEPGTPQAGNLEKKGNIPINQTDTPVQFGEVLTALQSDTREDLKDFFREYGQNALGNGAPQGKSDAPRGADYYNQSLDFAPGALKNSSIANDATLGKRPGDLYRVIKSQQKVAKALSTHPENLKDLVTNLNVTARALSSDESALQQLAPTLRDTVVEGRPALAALDAALPSLRAFARDALPAAESSPETLRASRPFIRQARGLVSEQELKGLTRDLKPTIPALARVNRGTIGLLDENRALSACQNNVLLPFAKTPIPDPDFANTNNNQPFYKQGPRGFVGLSGESRLFDANSPLFHINFGTGPTTIVTGDRGESFFAQAPEPPAGIRPIRPDSRPKFRPDVPCETQEPPDLNAPGGRPERSFTPGPGSLIPGVVCNIIGGELIPCPSAKTRGIYEKGQVQLNQLRDFFKRQKAGKRTPDPLDGTPQHFLKQLDEMGLESTKDGRIREKRRGAAKTEDTAASSEDTAP